MNYFECKISYEKTMENGKQKTGAKEVITIIKKEETKEETLEIDYPETDDEF